MNNSIITLVYKSMDFRTPRVGVYSVGPDGQEQRHDLTDYDLIAWMHRRLGDAERACQAYRWEANEVWTVQTWQDMSAKD
jgi:hypothetical protein